MIDFEIAWSEFDQRYHHSFKDKYWNASFDLVDNWVEEVKYFIHQKDAANSLAVLHQIRYQLNDARSTHQIDYWLDEVWDLEDAIELSLEVATDAMLCQNEQAVLNELKGEVDYHWQNIETSNIDIELFEFDNNKISNLIYREKQLNQALIFMDNAIYEKECEQISIAAKQLKQSYFEYLSVFGEFRTISDAIALQ